MNKQSIAFWVCLLMAGMVNGDDIDKVYRFAEKCSAGDEEACTKLAYFARSNPEAWIREAAVKRITDQSVLAKIARKDENKYVREAATKRLTNLEALAKIARKDDDDWVRQVAVQKPVMTDQDVLYEVATKDENVSVRRAAVQKLEDPIRLAKIAQKDEEWLVREAAVNNTNLTDQTLLEKFATKDMSDGVRKSAIRKLTDQSVLIRIVKNEEEFWWVRVAAVWMLTDQDLLANIAEKNEILEMRSAAKSRLTMFQDK